MKNTRKAVVTGAASGIGKAIATELINQGYQVVAVDLNKIEIASAIPLTCDITNPNAPTKIANAIQNELGGLDVLIHAAGICPVQMIEDLSLTEFHRVMSVNLESVLAITQNCLPELKQSGSGRIITIGSIMSEHSGAGVAAYSTSKHALLGLTRSFATEFGQFNITANCIQPGAILTAITQEAHDNDQNFRDYWINKSALKRWGTPQDIANLATFLASEKASFISGHGIYADGAAMQSA